jgi:hypothetical protein
MTHSLASRHIRHLVPRDLGYLPRGILRLAYHTSASIPDWAFFMGSAQGEHGLYPMADATGRSKDDIAIAAIRDGNRDCVVVAPVETTWDLGYINPIVKRIPNP